MIPAITISGVHKDYGSLKALSNIDLVVKQGMFFGLLGPNGAGKSTLINIMAGLVSATKGKVEIMGYDVNTQWRQARQSIGIVPQELVTDPFFTVREMLRLQSGYFGKGKENHRWVDELIGILGLTDKAEENLQKLSGGMKRRVLIAQALVHKPDVLVLDEPTAGVDVELRKVLWDFIKKLHNNGHTILLTTHYLEEAESLCEQIAILDEGKLAALDTKERLLERFPYSFLSLHLKETNDSLPEIIKSKLVSMNGNKITLKLNKKEDSAGSLLEVLFHSNIRFTDLRTYEPGLEEVFDALTGGKFD